MPLKRFLWPCSALHRRSLSPLALAESSYGLNEIFRPGQLASDGRSLFLLLLLLSRLSPKFPGCTLFELALLDRESTTSSRLFRHLSIIGFDAPRTSAPMLEQVMAKSASGLFVASCAWVCIRKSHFAR